MSISIRPVTTIAECGHIEMITAAAWGAGPSVVVPDHLLITLAHNQGVVLLAWDDDRPVGFAFTFPSFYGPDQTLKHCSHMAGVLPEYQAQGVGERLKWAQRDGVLAQGIELITWTYDPLETRNGRLNLHKLGAVCNAYKRNVYGELQDTLNQGLPSDRFQVDWWLASTRVHDCAAGTRPADPAVSAALNHVSERGSWPAPAGWNPARLETTSTPLRITVPADFQGIKSADFGLAVAWREATRTYFEAAFAAGFVAVDLQRVDALCHYVLRHGWQPERVNED